jgi:hypothetical protein
MRPNFPSQMAQRFAATSRRYGELLHIFASCGSRGLVHETQMTPDLKPNLLHHGVADTLGSTGAIMRRPSVANSKSNFGVPLCGYGIADRCASTARQAQGRCIRQPSTISEFMA